MNRTSKLLACCCLPLAVLAQPALAQDTGMPSSQETSYGLGEIVVTAQKRAESLQDTPLAVSAVTAEMIEARGITDVSSLTAVAPNISVTTAPASSSNTTIFIRGIGDQEPVLTADAPVSIYVDGIVLGRSTGAVFDLVDLERIEVLRGPQGTLYGRNTIGGAVNLISAKPADTFGIKQKLSYGSFNQWASRTTLDTGELGNSGIRAKFSYVHREQDGYVDDTTAPASRDPGALNIDALRAAVSFDKGGAFRAHYAFDFNHRESIAPAFQAVVVNPVIAQFLKDSAKLGGSSGPVSPTRLDSFALGDDGLLTDKVWGHTLTLEVDIGENMTLKSLTGHRKWRNTDLGDDLDGIEGVLGLAVSPMLFVDGTFDVLGVQEATLFTATNFRKQKQWSQEFNLTGTVGDRLEYVAGVFYFEESSQEINPQFPAVVIPSEAPIPLGPGLSVNSFFVPVQALMSFRHKSKSQAAFAQATYDLTDKLSFTGGIRYTKDTKHLMQVAAFQRDLEASFDRFNWAASVDYQATPDILAYARVATGYKAGGFNARSSNSGYNPEDLTSFEVGLKTELLDRRLRFNVAGFHMQHKDLQVQQFQAGAQGSTSVTVNAGKAKYTGIEVETQAILVPGFQVFGTMGYVDRKYDEFLILDPATDKIVNVADTARFPHSAALTWNVGAQYDVPEFPVGKLSARVEYNHRGRTYFHPTTVGTPLNDVIAADGRGLLDGRITLSEIPVGGTQVSIAVWGKNLTDEEYRVHGIDFGGLGYGGAVYGEPRSFGVDLTAQF